MTIVKVWTEIDDDIYKSLVAKVVSKKDEVFTIRYLSPTNERDAKKRRIFRYEDETYEVTDESITDYFDDEDDETIVGFQDIGEGEFIKIDDCTDSSSDSDYIPSSSESESEDGSLVDDYSTQEEDEEDNYFSD